MNWLAPVFVVPSEARASTSGTKLRRTTTSTALSPSGFLTDTCLPSMPPSAVLVPESNSFVPAEVVSTTLMSTAPEVVRFTAALAVYVR